jgi:hypothetical protein
MRVHDSGDSGHRGSDFGLCGWVLAVTTLTCGVGLCDGCFGQSFGHY